jgi:hypothetical protein
VHGAGATIEVFRNPSWYRDRLRSYEVEVDGKKGARLKPGGTANVPVAPGNHGVRITIDWCSSRRVEVSVAEGETRRLRCRAAGNPLLIPLYLTVWRDRYVVLEQVNAP